MLSLLSSFSEDAVRLRQVTKCVPWSPFSGWGPANTQLLWMPGQNSSTQNVQHCWDSRLPARYLSLVLCARCWSNHLVYQLAPSSAGTPGSSARTFPSTLQNSKSNLIPHLLGPWICSLSVWFPFLLWLGEYKRTSSYVKCQISIPLSGMYLDLLLFKFIFV